jgi:hypothetical protein
LYLARTAVAHAPRLAAVHDVVVVAVLAGGQGLIKSRAYHMSRKLFVNHFIKPILSCFISPPIPEPTTALITSNRASSQVTYLVSDDIVKPPAAYEARDADAALLPRLARAAPARRVGTSRVTRLCSQNTD